MLGSGTAMWQICCRIVVSSSVGGVRCMVFVAGVRVVEFGSNCATADKSSLRENDLICLVRASLRHGCFPFHPSPHQYASQPRRQPAGSDVTRHVGGRRASLYRNSSASNAVTIYTKLCIHHLYSALLHNVYIYSQHLDLSAVCSGVITQTKQQSTQALQTSASPPTIIMFQRWTDPRPDPTRDASDP